MKKILFLLLPIACYLLPVQAQSMSDEEVIGYAIKQNAAGVSQQKIAMELLSKGVTQQQLQRIKKKYESSGFGLGTGSSKSTTTTVDRSRKNNGQAEPDKKEAEEEAKLPPIPAKKIIFGHDIFTKRDLSFKASANVATPSDYILGPGDNVILDIYGSSSLMEQHTIAPDGTITITEEGPIAVSGLTIAQAQAKVKRTIGGHYQGSKIKLSVGQTRTVLVNVMGEVKNPGTYATSAFSTVFNALYLAGGVNDIGTMRSIKVSRNGRIITSVDVYEYILNGRLTGNVTLKDNDVIIVGPYDNLVLAEGNVKRPMYYEMKKGESLQSLLKYAGGFTGDAYRQKVRVERKSDEGLTVYNVDEFDFSSFKLEDGDVALVDSAIARMKNTLIIKGAVFRPGNYKLSQSVNSVRTLVEQAGGLVEDAYATRAVLHRMKADRTLQTMTINLADIMSGKAPDVVLKNEDELIINSNKQLFNSRTLTIYGDVFKPGEYPYSEGETVEDLIIEAGGLKESASLNNVEVARRIITSDESEDGMKMATIHNFTLQDGLAIEGDTHFTLKPYDVVTIHKNPDYVQLQRVMISGEVKYEGSYMMTSKQERLSDIIKRAGGLKQTAYIEGVQLIRRYSEKERELLKHKMEIAKNETGGNASNYSAGDDENPDIVVDKAIDDSIRISETIKNMTYTVGVDLRRAMDFPGSSYDIVLQENDSIYVPKLNNTVKISGEVLLPNTVAYSEGKSVTYYLNQAGGVSEEGKKSRTYIVYPNGQVSRATKGRVKPGCEIVVPVKKEKKVDAAKVSMWASLASTITVISSVIATILKK